AASSSSSSSSSLGGGGGVATVVLPDGTVRRSFAASTLPENRGGIRPVEALEAFVASSASGTTSESCRAFRAGLGAFRAAADEVTHAFARRLSSEMGGSLPRPLLKASGGGGYDDVADVVSGGVHLEHFHSYQKQKDAREGGSSDEAQAIEFHTDQGFFIAFAPGLTVSTDGQGGDEAPELSGGFYVRDADGAERAMAFDDEDDLVFMMGDGANQFVNNQIVGDDREPLRAAPHALTLPSSSDDPSRVRVWYGRMVLAPDDAYVPGTASTFGRAREALVAAASSDDVPLLGLGCSSPRAEAIVGTTTSSRRSLATECAEDELYCWFRCQVLEDFGTSYATCEERRLEDPGAEVQCMNPRGQVHPNGKDHGDFYPGEYLSRRGAREGPFLLRRRLENVRVVGRHL
ncbi:hypothetical protein ACHAWF_003080, partial [Thalassiosira exigua]